MAETKERFNNLCKAWNWNLHPIEVAKVVKQMDLDDEDFILMYQCIKEYFNAETADQIEEFIDYV